MRRPTVDERRTEILETTCQVVIERGFAGTRVADVARRVGISTGLVHYHFESKDQLLAAAFQYAAEADLNRLAVEVGAAKGALARLDRLVSLASPQAVEADWMLWIDGWGEALRTKEMRQISQDLDLRFKDLVESVIREGIDDGSFRCDDPTASAWRISAVLDGLSLQATVHEGVIARRDILSWVRKIACWELGLADGSFDSVAVPDDGVVVSLARARQGRIS